MCVSICESNISVDEPFKICFVLNCCFHSSTSWIEPNALACEIAHGRLVSFFYGQLPGRRARYILFVFEALLALVQFIAFVCAVPWRAPCQ